MALLGWVPFGPGGSHGGVAVRPETQPRFVHNRSGRYESRFPTVRIAESPAVLLRGMAGSALGVWTQHGEGQAHFPDGAVLEGERCGGEGVIDCQCRHLRGQLSRVALTPPLSPPLPPPPQPSWPAASSPCTTSTTQARRQRHTRSTPTAPRAASRASARRTGGTSP